MKSLHIILEKFKEGVLTEEQAVNIIEELYINRINYPYYPWISTSDKNMYNFSKVIA